MKGKIMEDVKSVEGAAAEKTESAAGKKTEFMDLTLAEIKRMDAKQLKKLCKEQGMATDGKREEFLNRVLAKRFGRTNRYVGAETRCQICAAEVRVTGTRTEAQGDGRSLVVRSIKCKGKHIHTYPLKELI